MLELTDDAKDVIRGIVEPDGGETGRAGVRITTTEAGAEGAELNLGLADGPEAGDETVEQDGVRVYLDAPASELLSDKVLDAQRHGDHVHFAIGEQGLGEGG